jgi:hypothetical protein
MVKERGGNELLDETGKLYRGWEGHLTYLCKCRVWQGLCCTTTAKGTKDWRRETWQNALRCLMLRWPKAAATDSVLLYR